jgi:hypothetical protein
MNRAPPLCLQAVYIKYHFPNPITACTRSAARRQRASPRRLFNSEVRKSVEIWRRAISAASPLRWQPCRGSYRPRFYGPAANGAGGWGRSACAPSPNGPPRAAPTAPRFAAAEAINYAARQDGRRPASQWGDARRP